MPSRLASKLPGGETGFFESWRQFSCCCRCLQRWWYASVLNNDNCSGNRAFVIFRGHSLLFYFHSPDTDGLHPLMRGRHPFVAFGRSMFALALKFAPEHRNNNPTHMLLPSNMREHWASARRSTVWVNLSFTWMWWALIAGALAEVCRMLSYYKDPFCSGSFQSHR